RYRVVIAALCMARVRRLVPNLSHGAEDTAQGGADRSQLLGPGMQVGAAVDGDVVAEPGRPQAVRHAELLQQRVHRVPAVVQSASGPTPARAWLMPGSSPPAPQPLCTSAPISTCSPSRT